MRPGTSAVRFVRVFARPARREGSRSTGGGLAPDFPGRFFAIPKVFQELLLAQRVHRLPEAAVLVSGELAVAHQAFHRRALENRIVAFDVVEYRGLEDEESSVDQSAVSRGLLPE